MSDRIISADGHMDLFYLDEDTFRSRAPANMKDRVPNVRTVDGKPTWVGDGAAMGGHRAWMGRQPMTNHRGRRMREAGWEPTHPSDPKLRARDMEIDNIEVEVIYGIRFVEDSIRDPDVITATYPGLQRLHRRVLRARPRPLHRHRRHPRPLPGRRRRGAPPHRQERPRPQGRAVRLLQRSGAHLARDVGTHVGRRGGGGSGAVLPHRRGPRHHHGGAPDRRGKAQGGYPEGIQGGAHRGGGHAGGRVPRVNHPVRRARASPPPSRW